MKGSLMDRKEFLGNLIDKYPQFFNTTKKTSAWINDYKTILPISVDYEKLNKAILFKYTLTAYPPTPAWLFTKWLEIKRQEEESQRNYTPSLSPGVPPPQEWLDLKKELNRKQQIMQKD